MGCKEVGYIWATAYQWAGKSSWELLGCSGESKRREKQVRTYER